MRRRLSLRLRLTGLVAIAATAVLALASLALYRDLSGEISDAITAELEIRLATLRVGGPELDLVGRQQPVIAQTLDVAGSTLWPRGSNPLLTRREAARAARGQIVLDREVPALGRRARLMARGLASEGVVGVAAASLAPLERARTRLLVILLVAGPILIAAITASAWLLAGAALRPVRRMAERARSISMSAPGERLPQPPGHDEIARLGSTLNDMLARIEATVEHERAFIDDASHELRTPLAVLRGELELACLDVEKPEEVLRSLESALEETDRLVALSDDLLTLARADAGQLTSGDAMTELYAAARAAAERLPAGGDVRVTVVGQPVDVGADVRWVDQILTNLITNAVHHARAEVQLTVGPTPGGAYLSVADDGAGFPTDLLPAALDRFTRGDTARGRGGTGLGLAIVSSLVTGLGGAVDLRNGPPLGGARVDVELPAPRR